MNREEIEQVTTRWVIEGWQRGRIAMVDELHAPQFIDHSAAGRPADRDGFKAGIRGLYEAFPDFHAQITDLVVDTTRSRVAVRWTAQGTHSGEFMGCPATRRTIIFAGIEIIHLDDGLITERWGEWNGDEILRQLT